MDGSKEIEDEVIAEARRLSHRNSDGKTRSSAISSEKVLLISSRGTVARCVHVFRFSSIMLFSLRLVLQLVSNNATIIYLEGTCEGLSLFFYADYSTAFK